MFNISDTFYYVLIGYFVIILGIGLWTGRGDKSKNSEE